jgi:hypothetical protein
VSKPPTPQAISALLSDAGFERGVSNPPELECAGYAVIPNRPDDGMVLVNWWESPSADRTDEAEHTRMLARYAEVLEGAGYRVRPAGGAYLVVSAKETDR